MLRPLTDSCQLENFPIYSSNLLWSVLLQIRSRLNEPFVVLRNLTNTRIGSIQRTLTIWESINVQLTSCLTGLDSTKHIKLMLIQHKKAAESKQNKQEVSHTVILPIKLVFSGISHQIVSRFSKTRKMHQVSYLPRLRNQRPLSTQSDLQYIIPSFLMHLSTKDIFLLSRMI